MRRFHTQHPLVYVFVRLIWALKKYRTPPPSTVVSFLGFVTVYRLGNGGGGYGGEAPTKKGALGQPPPPPGLGNISVG